MRLSEIVEGKNTWYEDGVEMCSKDCCGQPVVECTCGPDCKHCECYKINETEVSERYGMRAGNTAQRQAQSDMVNMNKRANNKAQDQNREIMLRQKSANRRAGRLQTKTATGLPSRLLNPQQPQAPEAQG